MNLDVYVFSFSKKRNSTKHPALESGTLVSMVWEQPYDIVNPSFMVRGSENTLYNYCYVPQLERYYWLTTSRKYRDKGLFYLDATVDVLATWYPYFSAQTFFIEYSASSYDTQYSDSRCASKCTTIRGKNSIKMPAISTNSFDIFYLEAIGAGQSGMFTNQYLVTPGVLGELAVRAMTDPDILSETGVKMLEQFSKGALSDTLVSLLASLGNDKFLPILRGYFGEITDHDLEWSSISSIMSNVMTTTYNNVAEIVTEKYKNPWDCIVGIKGLAIDSGSIFEFGSPQAIMLGSVDSKSIGRRLTDTMSRELTAEVTIPWVYKDPVSGSIADFRNCEPYTTVSITIPNCGVVQLSAKALYNNQSLTLRYKVNASTGDVGGFIECGGNIISDFSFNVSTNVSSGQASPPNGVKTAAGVVDVLASIITRSPISTSISDIFSYNAHVSGMTGGFCAVTDQITIEVISSATQDPSSLTALGRPCRRRLDLNTLTGYTECRNAYADCPATLTEHDTINSMLNGGFYIE